MAHPPASAASSWLKQWQAAGPALEEVRRRELRELRDDEALAAAEAAILEHLGDAYRKALRDADAARAWRRALQALDEGADPDLPGQRAGIEKKLRDLPGGDVRPARR